MTTKAQERQRAVAVDAFMTFQADLEFDQLCDAFTAAAEARPDIDPDLLTALGNRLCQMADEAEREQRRAR